jgi:hypothetical protein
MSNDTVKIARKSPKEKDPRKLKKSEEKASRHEAKHRKTANAPGKDTAPGSDSIPEEQIRIAFHHMQRASVVISLMEKGTGEDLRGLLTRGVKFYEQALHGKGNKSAILKAIGLLRAAEHLALAGLYDARHKHRQKVEAPPGSWLERCASETNRRLKLAEDKERGKGPDLLPVAEELVLQAEESADDPHLAFELVMAAEALCFALENGL